MKKGITITTLTLTVIIMLIIIGTASAVGVSAIHTAAYEEFVSKLNRVSDCVNEYYLSNKELPITNEIVSKEGLKDSLKNEIITNKDGNNELCVIDMRKINAESVNIGKGTVSNMDVFLVASGTNNIYYLRGMSYKGTTYHGVVIE